MVYPFTKRIARIYKGMFGMYAEHDNNKKLDNRFIVANVR